MSRTIEAIIAHMAPLKRGAITNTKPLDGELAERICVGHSCPAQDSV